MSSDRITGSCLCGAVRFAVSPPYAAFRYCYCSRCRKASGSAHAANLFVPEEQFAWLAGAAEVRRFDLPGAKRFAVSFCPQCGTRVPHAIATAGTVLIPAGVLDADPGILPDMRIYWGSKAPWYVAPDALQTFEEHSG